MALHAARLVHHLTQNELQEQLIPELLDRVRHRWLCYAQPAIVDDLLQVAKTAMVDELHKLIDGAAPFAAEHPPKPTEAPTQGSTSKPATMRPCNGEAAAELQPVQVPSADAQHGDSTIEATTSIKGAFPVRAAWLEDRLHERGWTKTNLRPWGGPDRKTVKKIREGLWVTESSLEKLVQALSTHPFSKKQGPVTLADVPNN